ITQECNEIEAKSQRLHQYFRPCRLTETGPDIVRCRTTSGRQPKIAMAAYKPKVVITQERNEIEAKSQRLHQYFRPCRITETGPDIVRCRTTSGRQPKIAMAAYKPEVVITLER